MVVPIAKLYTTPPEVLKRYVQFFISDEHIPLNWECTDQDPVKNLENLLSLSDGKIGQRSTNAVAFYKTLLSWSAFPSSEAFFKNPKTVLYIPDVRIYQSLGKKEFVYKRDIHPMLQTCIPIVPLELLEAELAGSMIAYFLKVQEEKVSASEMTELNRMTFEDVKSKIEQINENFIGKEWQDNMLKVRFDRKSSEEAEKQTTMFLDSILYEEDNKDEIMKLLRIYTERHLLEHTGFDLLKTVSWVLAVTVIFKAFIDKNADFWKTSKQVVEPTQDSKVIVRLFVEKEKKLVMVHELYQRMKIGGLDVSGMEKMVREMPEVGTVTFRQVFEIVPRDVMKNIEFVCVVTESKLIPLVNWGYCFVNNGKLVLYGNNSRKAKAVEKVEVIESDGQSPATSNEEIPKKFVEDAVEEKQEQRHLEKTKKKKVRAPRKKIVIQRQAPKPETKESEACQKCFRASQHTRVSNEKLRLEKIESRHLRKRLAEMELKNLENEEKILTMMESQKKEMAEKEEMIRSHKEKIEELQKQVNNQKKIIEDLESAISLAPVPEVMQVLISDETAPTRLNEETGAVLFSLLEARETFRKENPISKVLQMTNKLMAKTNSVEVRRRSRFETIFYRQSCTKYIEAVESNLDMIRDNQTITTDQIPKLPVFPTLSQWFKDAYKETMKVDAPTICESLMRDPEVNPDELVDKECLICLEHMGSDEETTKCECCKRRYHGECIKEWFKTKRMCPTCNSGMLDSHEFPALS